MQAKCAQLVAKSFWAYFRPERVHQQTDFDLRLSIQPKRVIKPQLAQNSATRNGSPTEWSMQLSVINNFVK